MPGRSHLVKPAGNGIATMSRRSVGFPAGGQPLLRSGGLERDAPSPTRFQGDDGLLIDVLVLYTPAAATAGGGTAAMNTLIANAVSPTNTSYANSGVQQRIRPMTRRR